MENIRRQNVFRDEASDDYYRLYCVLDKMHDQMKKYTHILKARRLSRRHILINI